MSDKNEILSAITIAAGALGMGALFMALSEPETPEARKERLKREKRRARIQEHINRAQEKRAGEYRKSYKSQYGDLDALSAIAVAFSGVSSEDLMVDRIVSDIVKCDSDSDRMALVRAYMHDGAEFSSVQKLHIRRSFNNPNRGRYLLGW